MFCEDALPRCGQTRCVRHLAAGDHSEAGFGGESEISFSHLPATSSTTAAAGLQAEWPAFDPTPEVSQSAANAAGSETSDDPSVETAPGRADDAAFYVPDQVGDDLFGCGALVGEGLVYAGAQSWERRRLRLRGFDLSSPGRKRSAPEQRSAGRGIRSEISIHMEIM